MSNVKFKSKSSKHKSFTFYVLVLSFTFCVLSLKARPVYAQSLSLSLWPPLLEVMIQPGRSIIKAYELTNNSDRNLQITPVVYPFEPLGDTGQIKIQNQGTAVNSQKTQFFSFDSGEKFNEPFEIKIGESRQIVLKITIPAGATENDYYYTLIFSAINPTVDEQGETTTSSLTQIGSNILLTVSRNGQPPLLGKIVNFSAPVVVDSFSSVEFKVVLENWGKSFWKPFGKISINGILKQNDEIPLLEQNVLANSSRNLSIAPYKPKLPLGPFKAKLEFNLDKGNSNEISNNQKLNTAIVFWYFPYKLAIVLIILLIVYLVIKKKIRKI